MLFCFVPSARSGDFGIWEIVKIYVATAGKIHLSQMPEISGFTLIQNIAKNVRVRYFIKHSLSENKT